MSNKPTTEHLSFRPIAARALAMIADGGVVGLGTGHAATAFIELLAERVQAGLRVRGVPTSQESAELARRLGIPLVGFDEIDGIDVAVDGADEVDPQLNLIKGYGGALVREKIVAAAARKLVILVGPEKIVPMLGSHGKLPVEVVPFGMLPCQRRLAVLRLPSEPRMKDGKLFVTDNGNHILDCTIGFLKLPAQTDLAIRAIPGIVGTGLFLGMATTVLVQRDGGVEVLGENC